MENIRKYSIEEHRKIFPEPPFIAISRCKNLKAILVRSKLDSEGNGVCDSRECSPCRKSRCQVCKVMCSTETFTSRATKNEYRINFSFKCDMSNVAYLLECNFCGLQHVGSTCTPFRVRFNNYKSYYRRFNGRLQGYPRLKFPGILRESVTGGSLKILEL